MFPGTTLVLFCCEKIEAIHNGLFGKALKQADCTRTAAAARVLPEAETSVNAKANFLSNVPINGQWYVVTDRSTNDNVCPFIHAPPAPGLASVAAGQAGIGRIVYMSDVNAEAETCSILISLAQSIFPDMNCSGSVSEPSSADRSRAEQHKAQGNAIYGAGSHEDLGCSLPSLICDKLWRCVLHLCRWTNLQRPKMTVMKR